MLKLNYRDLLENDVIQINCEISGIRGRISINIDHARGIQSGLKGINKLDRACANTDLNRAGVR